MNAACAQIVRYVIQRLTLLTIRLAYRAARSLSARIATRDFSFPVDLPPQAVDRFVNGDFYRHPLTAEAILDVALELRVRAPQKSCCTFSYRWTSDAGITPAAEAAQQHSSALISGEPYSESVHSTAERALMAVVYCTLCKSRGANLSILASFRALDPRTPEKRSSTSEWWPT